MLRDELQMKTTCYLAGRILEFHPDDKHVVIVVITAIHAVPVSKSVTSVLLIKSQSICYLDPTLN